METNIPRQLSKLGKSSKNFKQTAISEHLLQCNYTINFGDFDISAEGSNKFKIM